MWPGRTQDNSLFCPNHIQRHQATSSYKDANPKSLGSQNKKDPGLLAGEHGRQLSGNRGQTKKGTKNRCYPEESLGGRFQLGKSRHWHARLFLRLLLLAKGEQYITAVIKTMAITRKCSQSSAEEDGSSDDHNDDGGPSKKKTSKNFTLSLLNPYPYKEVAL